MREERFATDRPIELSCHNSCGTIAISTVDAAEATISVSGPREILDALRIELDDGRLTVAEPSHTFRDLVRCCDRELSLTVSVPHESAASLRTASTEATLDGTFSRIESASASGALRVTGEVLGDVTATSASGEVGLPEVGGDVRIRSSSGDVRVGALHAGHVSVQSASGDITLGVRVGCAVDLDATSASGELSSEIPLGEAPAGEAEPALVIRAATASGDIRLVRAHVGATPA